MVPEAKGFMGSLPDKVQNSDAPRVPVRKRYIYAAKTWGLVQAGLSPEWVRV